MTTAHSRAPELAPSLTPSTAQTVTVTVLDAASIYESAETIYRYDVPGSGIVEGWALASAIDQCAKLVGPAWPDAAVTVLADSSGTEITERAVEVLRRQLTAAGATVARTEEQPAALGSADRAFDQPSGWSASPRDAESARGSAPEPEDTDAAYRHRGARGSRADAGRRGATSWRDMELPLGIDPFYVLIAAVVLGVAVAAWWAVGLKQESAEQAQAQAQAIAANGTGADTDTGGSGVPDPGPPSGAGADVGEEAPPHRDPGANPAKAGQKVIDVEGMSVVLPQGFHASVQDGLVTATGEDPELRILLAADPLYHVPIEELFKEISSQIEADPALRDPQVRAGRLSYTEDPGDGSLVTWMTWEDAGHQMSVGCHTRHAPNVVHKAACRMAAESLVKK